MLRNLGSPSFRFSGMKGQGKKWGKKMIEWRKGLRKWRKRIRRKEMVKIKRRRSKRLVSKKSRVP